MSYFGNPPQGTLDVLNRLGSVPAMLARAHVLGVLVVDVSVNAERVYIMCADEKEAERLAGDIGIDRITIEMPWWSGEVVTVHLPFRAAAAVDAPETKTSGAA